MISSAAFQDPSSDWFVEGQASQHNWPKDAFVGLDAARHWSSIGAHSHITIVFEVLSDFLLPAYGDRVPRKTSFRVRVQLDGCFGAMLKSFRQTALYRLAS